MPSPAAAKAVYEPLLKRLLECNPEDWSLVSGFFHQKPMLAFLWEPSLDAELVASAARLVTLAGGEELAEEAQQTLLTQILARRAGLHAKEPFETLVAHHPKGKPIWDLED
jgi:hypothetical protein